MSKDNLYESFKNVKTQRLGDKYRYLRHNTNIYQDYPFRIGQIREPDNQVDEKGNLKPPHLNGFGFSAPGEDLIRDMLIRFQDETGYITVNLNNQTFSLTQPGIIRLRQLDPSLE